MRNLHKTEKALSWYANDGTPLMQIRKGKRGAEYICFMIEVPGQGLPGMTESATLSRPGKRYVPRDFRDLRMPELRKAAQQIASYLEENKVKQETAELALDLIYAELNRRLNKQ